MKIFKLLALAVVVIGFVSSCAEQIEATPDVASPEFVAVTIPDVYKATTTDLENATDSRDLLVDVVLTNGDGEDIYGQVHLVTVGASKLSVFEVSPNILEENDWTTNFWLEGFDPNAPVTEGACRDACQEQYVDEDGNETDEYKSCISDCWLNAGVAVAVIVLSVVQIIKDL